jgi:hypothetical protein
MTDEDYTRYLNDQMAAKEWGPLADALMRDGAFRAQPAKAALQTPIDETDRRFLRGLRIRWEDGAC